MARKLKVFQAQFGFWDCVVAAPSRAAALRAWGTRQNLFADGGARETTEADAVAVATAHPETPLRRAVGSSDPFGLEPRLPRLPDGPRPAMSRRAAKPRPVRPPAAPPDRGALDAAQAALDRIDADRRDDEAAFARRRSALEHDEETARQRHAAARSRAADAVDRCREAFVKAGGRTDP